MLLREVRAVVLACCVVGAEMVRCGAGAESIERSTVKVAPLWRVVANEQ